ncbi:MAG: rRNA binding protein [Amphiamblys sp. WSBS2006]|nr:MAG: rRNA binding protein [Amphiamblys sp. WSBS2006]
MKKTVLVFKAKGTGSYECRKPTKWTKSIVGDLRKVFYPYSPESVPERNERASDFARRTEKTGLTHMVSVSQHGKSFSTARHLLSIGKCGKGPTVVFDVAFFSLAKDIAGFTRERGVFGGAPLLLLSNFDAYPDSEEKETLVSVLGGLFPEVETKKEAAVERVVMLHYADGKIELRNYGIRKRVLKVSRPVRKLLSKGIPNMHGYDDMSEYFSAKMCEETSGSDGEEVVGEGEYRKGIRLSEIGPRLTLLPRRIQKGLFGGKTLWERPRTGKDAE